MLLRTVLASFLLSGSVIAADLPSSSNPFSGTNIALTSDELSNVRGMGLVMVGTDQEQAAADASTITIGEIAARYGDGIQELTDNWNSVVATPLIAAATATRVG